MTGERGSLALRFHFMANSKDEVKRDADWTREEAQRALQNVGEVWTGKNAVASAWRSTKGTLYRAQDRVLETAHATDETIRSNIYSSLGIAVGLGALIGFFVTRKPSIKRRN